MKNFITLILFCFIFSGLVVGQNVVGTIELDWEEIELPQAGLTHKNVFIQNGELFFDGPLINNSIKLTFEKDGLIYKTFVNNVNTGQRKEIEIAQVEGWQSFRDPNNYYTWVGTQVLRSDFEIFQDTIISFVQTHGLYYYEDMGQYFAPYNTPYSQRYISYDNGENWEGIDVDDPWAFSNGNTRLNYGGIEYYCANGNMYKERTPGSQDFDVIYESINQVITSFRIRYGEIFAFSHDGVIIRSKDSGNTWNQIHKGTCKPYNIGPNVFYECPEWEFSGFDSSLHTLSEFWGRYTYNQDSTSWDYTPESYYFDYGYYTFGDTILAGTKGAVLRSFDNGNSWETIRNARDLLKYSNGIIYKGSSYSSDFGDTWSEIQSYRGFYEVCNDTIIAERDGSLYRTTNFGETWVDLYPKEKLKNLVKIKNTWAAVNNSGIYISKDGGTSWFQTYPATGYPWYHTWVVDSFIIKEGATIDEYIITKDFGYTWYKINIPLSEWDINSILIIDDYLYVTPSEYLNHSVYRVPLNSINQKISTTNDAFGFLTGNSYYDRNQNCIFDSTDVPIINKTIEFEPGPSVINSGESGLFGIALKSGTYDVSVTAPKYHNLCTNSTSVEIERNETDTLQIGFQPIPGNPDLKVNIMNQNRARPGFPLNFAIQIENLGTEIIENGKVEIIFPKDHFEILNTPPNSTVSDESVIILLNSLDLYSTEVYQLETRILPSVPISEEFNIIANIPDDFSDKNVLDNIDTIGIFTRGSYDPNDKQLLSDQNVIAGNHEMEYLIRFQNTGTDTAFTVEVIDTLHHKFDLASLETIQTSHDYQMKIEENRVVSWKFYNILLADSIINEPESHGFIHFKIKTKYPVHSEEKIENSASIYFDFNDPIITNDAVLCAENGVINVTIDAEVCPRDYFWIDRTRRRIYNDTIIIDSLKTPLLNDSVITYVINVLPESYTDVDSILISGDYFSPHGGYADSTLINSLFTKFIGRNIHGCDSFLNIRIVDVVDYEFISDSFKLELCQGNYFNNILIKNDTTITEIHPIRIGFDSIVHTQITTLPALNTFIEETICNENIYQFLDYNFYETGQYEIQLPGSNGCDSTIHLDLKFGVSTDTSIYHELTAGEIFDGIPIWNDTIFSTNYLGTDGCDSIVTNIISVQTSSIGALENSSYLKVFPNPTSGEITIEIDGLRANESAIKLLDVHGKICLTKNWLLNGSAAKQQLKLELKNLPSGVYFIEFQTEKERKIEKILLE